MAIYPGDSVIQPSNRQPGPGVGFKIYDMNQFQVTEKESLGYNVTSSVLAQKRTFGLKNEQS